MANRTQYYQNKYGKKNHPEQTVETQNQTKSRTEYYKNKYGGGQTAPSGRLDIPRNVDFKELTAMRNLSRTGKKEWDDALDTAQLRERNVNSIGGDLLKAQQSTKTYSEQVKALETKLKGLTGKDGYDAAYEEYEAAWGNLRSAAEKQNMLYNQYSQMYVNYSKAIDAYNALVEDERKYVGRLQQLQELVQNAQEQKNLPATERMTPARAQRKEAVSYERFHNDRSLSDLYAMYNGDYGAYLNGSLGASDEVKQLKQEWDAFVASDAANDPDAIVKWQEILEQVDFDRSAVPSSDESRRYSDIDPQGLDPVSGRTAKNAELLKYMRDDAASRVEQAKVAQWDAQVREEILASGGEELMSLLLEMEDARRKMDNLTKPGQPVDADAYNEYNAIRKQVEQAAGDRMYDWEQYAERMRSNQLMAAREASIAAATGKNGWVAAGMNLAAVPFSLASGVGMLDVGMQKLERAVMGSDAPIDYNSDMQIPGKFSSTVRDTTASMIEEKTRGKAGSDTAFGNLYTGAYQLGTSMLDSAAVVGMSLLGIPGGTWFLGGSAGNQAMLNAKERGASDMQALGVGAISAVAEAMFENVGIDNLTKNIKDATKLRHILRSAAKQAIPEATEEGLTNITNLIADRLIMGGLSEYETSIRNYMARGMSRADAAAQANKDTAIALATDVIGGAISGGIFGLGGGALNVAINGRNNAQTEQQIASEAMPEAAKRAEIVQTAQSQTPNALMEAALEMHSETPATTDVQRANEAASKAFGETGKRAFATLNDGTTNPEQLYKGFAVMYNAGQMGRAQSEVTQASASALSDLQARVAYEAGQKDAELASKTKTEYNKATNKTEDMTYGAEAVHLRDSSQRTGSAYPGGQVSAVEESAGRNQSWEAESGPADGEAASLTYGEEVSTASLGISGGTKTARVRIVTGGDTAATRAAKQTAKDNGLELVMFAGGNLEITNDSGITERANGYIVGNKAYVRVDHRKYTADQIMRHEAGHARIDRGEIDVDAVRDRIVKEYGVEELDYLSELYAEAYSDTGLSADQVWAECICDSLGDMNIFTELSDVASTAEVLLGQVKESAEATARESMGPPAETGSGKMSREKWYPDLSKAKLDELKQWVKRDIRTSENSIGDNANWTFREFDNLPVFAIYSTKNADDPTILYESKGEKAKFEKDYVSKFLEELFYGGSANGKPDTVDKVLGRSWVRPAGGVGNDNGTLGRGRSSGDAGVLRKQSRRKPSPALESVIRNLFQVQAGGERGGLSRELNNLADLRKQNDALRKEVEYWKRQTKQTTPDTYTVRQDDVDKLARRLVRDYNSTLKADDISPRLKELGEFILRNTGTDDLTWGTVKEKAVDIARDMIRNAKVLQDDAWREYSDLRQHLRTTEIRFGPEYRSDIADYNDFRKRNFGRLKLVSGDGTNVDQVYKELSEMWPEFFSEDIVNPADQLLRIGEVLDSLKPVYENPHSYHMAEATEYLSNEIIDSLIGEDVRQDKTIADRQADRAKKTEAALRKVIESRDRSIAASRERRRAVDLRRKIERHAKEMSQKLLRPTDKKHVPDELQSAVAAVLNAINLESKYAGEANLEANNRTKAFRKLRDAYKQFSGDIVVDPALFPIDGDQPGLFHAVIEMGDTLIAEMDSEQLEKVWYVLKATEHAISTANKLFMKAKYDTISGMAEKLEADSATRRGKTAIRVPKVLGGSGNLAQDLKTPLTFFSQYGEIGKQVYHELRDAQDYQEQLVDRLAAQVGDIVTPKQVQKLQNEVHTFKTKGGATIKLSTAHIMELYELTKRKQAEDHLMKGGIVQPEIKSANIERGTDMIALTAEDLGGIFEKLTDEQKQIADNLQKLMTTTLASAGNEASMKAYGYKKFTSTDYWPIQSAKEALHSNVEKNANNTRSIKNIGLAQQTVPHASTALNLNGVFQTFASHSADMIDYAAWLCPMEDVNRLFNYKYVEKVGDKQVPTGKTVKGILDKVGGVGSQAYWSNLMEDIQNGLGGPGDSTIASTAAKIVGNVKGASVGANIRVVVQQPTAIFRAASVLSLGNMAKGLTKGATRGNGWKKALKYSPIAQRKDRGGFEVGNQMQMSEILFDDRTALSKLSDKLSWAAAKADAVTWGKIWNACEWQVRDQHQNVHVGSEEFYVKVAELFSDVVNESQVVDGVLQRSQIMRSSNQTAKQMTSFMGEPTMSLNMLMRAYDAIRYETDKPKRGKAIKHGARVAASLLVADIMTALMQSLVDGLRDDEPDKKYLERVHSAFTGITGDEESAWEKAVGIVLSGNLASSMNPVGRLPYAKDLLSLVQGYSVERMDISAFGDLISAASTLVSTLNGDGDKTLAYSIKQLASAGSKLFGISASNILRDVWGIARSIAIETGNLPLQYEMEKMIHKLGNGRGEYFDIMWTALKTSDMETYDRIFRDLHQALIEQGDNGVTITNAMKSRYKKELKKDPSFQLNQQAADLIGIRGKYDFEEDEPEFSAADLDVDAYKQYAYQQAQTYRKLEDQLLANEDFSGMTPETKDKLIAAADKLSKLTALEDASDGEYEVDVKWVNWATDGASYGVDEVEAILFKVAYDMAHKGDKPVSGSKKKNTIEQAREWMPWLTNRELEYLKSNYWKSETK